MKKTRLGIVGPGLIWEDTHKPVLESLRNLFSIEAFSASSEASNILMTLMCFLVYFLNIETE